MDACVACAHVIDDKERARTGALRTISAQVDLLTDALHALRAGRAAVTDEFLDRAIGALTAEAARLRADH